MNYQTIKRSSNAKIGPIFATNSHRDTCPTSCPFIRNGCYADAGFHTRLNWDKLSKGERGGSYQALCDAVSALGDGVLWRHNVSGDLVGHNDTIDRDALRKLTEANGDSRGFTYTHYPVSKAGNLTAIKEANANGFTVNLSANTAREAARLFKEHGLPTVCVLPIESPKLQKVDGVDVVTCPATHTDNVTCKTCKLCAVSDRKVVVGFPAHGTSKKAAELIATDGV